MERTQSLGYMENSGQEPRSSVRLDRFGGEKGQRGKRGGAGAPALRGARGELFACRLRCGSLVPGKGKLSE